MSVSKNIAMRSLRSFSLLKLFRRSLFCSSPPEKPFVFSSFALKPLLPQNSSLDVFAFLHPFTYLCSLRTFPSLPSAKFRSFSSSASSHDNEEHEYETEGDMVIEEWEEEDEFEPEIGDGGAGGGIVLQNVPWGERVLSIVHEVLLQFGDDIKLFSFKTTPRGYIYIRLDKLTNEYGCPSMEEIESYSKQYKKRLEEEGSKGHIPEDLALEVSSPGAERLLRVPEDLHRFKDYPMVVTYIDTEAKDQEKNGVLFLDSIDSENEESIWKLADVKENRDPASKGRPMSRKQKDWRLKLPYSMLKKVTFYLEF